MLMTIPFNRIAYNVEELLGHRFDYGLAGGTAISQVYTEGDDLHVVALDESNAFTSVMVPEWLSYWQCSPPLLAMHV